MEYTETERQTLDILGRTDFQAIKKGEIVSIASLLSSLRPEVAKSAIEHFPELADLLKVSISEYRDMLDKVIESDNARVSVPIENLPKGIYILNVFQDNYLIYKKITIQ